MSLKSPHSAFYSQPLATDILIPTLSMVELAVLLSPMPEIASGVEYLLGGLSPYSIFGDVAV